VAGDDGLAALRAIAAGAAAQLEPGGWILLEHGQDQHRAVQAFLAGAGLESVSSWADLAGIARVTGGKLKS
ncbi:MAG: peptide chain release factor N(5)-glutamine methyltransferase, partial [Burkholderiales bacterium]